MSAAALARRIQGYLAATRAFLARARKAAAAVAGVAATLLAANLLPDPVAGYVSAGLAVLGAVGVYTVPNAKQLPLRGAGGRFLSRKPKASG